MAVRRRAAQRVTVPTRAGLGIRISDDKAGDELGVKRQEHDCRALARRRGWRVAEVYVENSVSASSGDPRPEYDRLLDDLATGHIDGLVAYHPDRLYRRLQDLEALIDAIEVSGAPVATVTAGEIDLTTASGRMIARQLGVAARYESERKGERLVSKHEELARDGKSSGGPAPFGYRLVEGEPDARGRRSRHLALEPAEAALIGEAARRVLNGELISHVVADLTAAGHRSRRGPLRPENMARVLLSGRIAGLRERYGQVVGPAVWPAVVTVEQHDRLVAILADPTRAKTKPFTRSLLGGGLARCGRCGSPLHAGRRSPNQTQQREGRRGFRVYLCASTRGGCGKLQIQAHHVERITVEALWLRLEGAGLAEAVARRVPDGSAAQAELEAVEAKLAALGVRWANGEITDAGHAAAEQTLRRKLAEAQARVSTSRRGEVLRRYRRVGELAGAWPALSFEDQRTIIGLMVEAVTINPAAKAGRTFDPDRVDVTWKA